MSVLELSFNLAIITLTRQTAVVATFAQDTNSNTIMSQLLKWSNLRNNKIYLALCPTTKFIESYFQMVEAMSERNKLDTRRCRRRKEESHTRHISNIPVTGVWNSDSVSEIHGGRCAFDHVRGRRRTEGRRGTVKREREREREGGRGR